MKTIIQVTNIENSVAIETYVGNKLQSLERLLDKGDESVIARVEVGKSTKHHKNGEVYFAEVNLHTRGKDFRSVEQADDLYAAIDAVKDELTQEVKSYQGKKRVVVTKGARAAKKALRRG